MSGELPNLTLSLSDKKVKQVLKVQCVAFIFSNVCPPVPETGNGHSSTVHVGVVSIDYRLPACLYMYKSTCYFIVIVFSLSFSRLSRVFLYLLLH